MENFEQYLMEKYPNLHPKDEDGNTLPPICGNDCPTGWYIVVDELCQCIHNYTTLVSRSRQKEDGSYERVYPPTIIIEQIKSKFGGLRFYYSGGDAEISGMIRFAEYLCSKTCEITGGKGRSVTINNWIWTLSEEEIQKRVDNS